MAFTFSKSERLCNKIIIGKLFEKGNRGFTQFPFRFSWVSNFPDINISFQLLIVVSKKNFPKAVDRNKIKRQIRSCYAKNKHLLNYLPEYKKTKIALLVNYVAKDKLAFIEIENSFVSALKKLKIELAKMDTSSAHHIDKSI